MHSPIRVSRIAFAKALVRIGAILAVAGVIAAAVAAGLSATPAGVSRLDRAAPALPAHHQTRQGGGVGLDHAGGDLRRAVRVTRRTNGNLSAQGLSWAGVALIIPRQVTPITANVA
jgi:hypothetical protein